MIVKPTPYEDWVARTMIAAYGMFALFGFLALPATMLFGFYVFGSVWQIVDRGWAGFDFPSFLALTGVGLFLSDLCMLFLFWRFVDRHSLFIPPLALWLLSVLCFVGWMLWFLSGAYVARLSEARDFPIYATCFLIWPFAGLMLSFIAFYRRFSEW